MRTDTPSVTSPIDPFGPEYRSDPYVFQEKLRDLGPVVWLSEYGVWACARHEEVVAVLGQPEAFSSRAGVGISHLGRDRHWRKPSILLENDPPDHTRIRTALMAVLSPRNVRRLREALEPQATQIIDEALDKQTVDGVSDIALPFPLKAFPDAVGLTPDSRENLLVYGRMVFDGMGPKNAIYDQVMADADRVTTWIDAQCKRDALSPNGLGSQVYEAVDSGVLTNDEAALTVRSFLSAGVDTTIHAIGNALYCFAKYPDQWKALRENHAGIRQAFEEVLRLHSPFQMFFRTATRNLDLAGTDVARDDKVLLMVGSANRDPRLWDSPEEFQVSRHPTGHLAFGRGVHTCVGQMIARLEADVLLTEMLQRVESMELDGDPIWQPSNTLHGLASLPLRINPK